MMIQALRKVIKRMPYPLEVMLTCVRWYAAYPLSLRDVEEMMAERGTGCRQDQKRPASERIHAAPSTPCPALRCVAYDFCLGRGGKYAVKFLGDWCATLVRDEFSGYASVVKLHERKAAGCLAHARRKFNDLIQDSQSPVALQAVQRIAWIYRIEREAQTLSVAD